MMLPLLVRAVAMGAAARRSSLRSAAAPPAGQAQQERAVQTPRPVPTGRPAPSSRPAQPRPPVDNYVLRVKEAGPAAPAPLAVAPESTGAEAGGAPRQPAPGRPAPPQAVALAAVLRSLPDLQRAWVALELLGPPVGLRDHPRDPW